MEATAKRARGVAAVFVFGGVFLAAGLAMFWFFTVPAWRLAWESRGWVSTPATVVASEVRQSRSRESTTYRVRIEYRYRYGGREYASDRGSAMPVNSSGYEAKAEVVRRHPSGTPITCFVNPANPGEALLERGFGWSSLFGLMPLVFVGLGLLAVRVGLSAGKGERNPAEALAPVVKEVGPLKAAASPGEKVLGAFLAAVIWNGITGVFVAEAVASWARGRPDWMLTIFMLPFVLVGVGLIALLGYTLLALRNPRAALRVESGRACPGGTLRVAWEFTGTVSRLRRMGIFLEGVEDVTIRQQKGTRQERAVFARLPMAEVDGSWIEMARGTAEVSIPRDAPPTFDLGNARIRWTIRVWGEVPNWPDLLDDYELRVESPGALKP